MGHSIVMMSCWSVSNVFLPARVKVEDKTSLSDERESYISIERDVFIKKYESRIVSEVVRKPLLVFV
jgi:hypothetical protein